MLIVQASLVALRTELGGDEALQRGLHRSRGDRVETAVEVDHPVPLEDREPAPAAQLALSRLHPVGIEPGLHPLDDLAQLIEGQPWCLVDQQLLTLQHPLVPRRDRDTVEHRDDGGGGLHAEPTGLQRVRDVRMACGRRFTGECRPRRRRLADLDETRRLSGRRSGRGRDQQRRVPVTVLLRQTLRSELSAGLVPDPCRDGRMDRVGTALQRSQRVVDRHQRRAAELLRVRRITPGRTQSLYGFDEPLQWVFHTKEYSTLPP